MRDAHGRTAPPYWLGLPFPRKQVLLGQCRRGGRKVDAAKMRPLGRLPPVQADTAGPSLAGQEFHGELRAAGAEKERPKHREFSTTTGS